MKAIKITTDNKITEINVEEPPHRSLGVEVGGFIEIVRPRRLKSPYVMIVDEEGLLKECHENLVGSVLYGASEHGYPIFGDIVIMREDFGPEGPDLFGLDTLDTLYISDLAEKILWGDFDES